MEYRIVSMDADLYQENSIHVTEYSFVFSDLFWKISPANEYNSLLSDFCTLWTHAAKNNKNLKNRLTFETFLFSASIPPAIFCFIFL